MFSKFKWFKIFGLFPSLVPLQAWWWQNRIRCKKTWVFWRFSVNIFWYTWLHVHAYKCIAAQYHTPIFRFTKHIMFIKASTWPAIITWEAIFYNHAYSIDTWFTIFCCKITYKTFQLKLRKHDSQKTC